MPKVYSDIVQRMWETKHELALVRQSQIQLWTTIDASISNNRSNNFAEEDGKLKQCEQELVSERLRLKPWNYAYV